MKKQKVKKEVDNTDKENHPEIGVLGKLEKPAKFKVKDDIVKIDFQNPPSKEVEGTSEAVIDNVTKAETMVQDVIEVKEPKVESKIDEVVESVTPIQEVTKDEVKEKFIPTDVVEPVVIPDNITDLIGFMKDTGGNVEDYVRLNADYSNADPDTLLKEFYKQTKPHLDKEEINFMMEDKFHYDEEYDEAKDIRKKQLAMKEEVAQATNFLDGLKDKYYRDIKLRPGTNKEQQKATDFFDTHNKEQEVAKKQHQTFKKSTEDFFNNEFKGFDFNVGEKKFRYGVKNPNEVATAQSDISTFIKKFLSEDGSVKDYDGYHKAIYAARNADTIAQHFYEQGKSDAVKDVMARSKNVSNVARKTATDENVYLNGLRIKAVSGVDSSKL